MTLSVLGPDVSAPMLITDTEILSASVCVCIYIYIYIYVCFILSTTSLKTLEWGKFELVHHIALGIQFSSKAGPQICGLLVQMNMRLHSLPQ